MVLFSFALSSGIGALAGVLIAPITYTAYGTESDPGPMPIPATAPIEGGSGSTGDRHVLVMDRDTCVLT